MSTAELWNERQRVQWTSAAAAWERRTEWFEGNVRELAAWFCEATRLAPGHQVLDLACGTGQPAMTLARAVGPTGKVLATDIARGMVEAATRRARSANITNIELREMDAQRLDLESSSFDAATCSFGLMFCPEPRKALAELRRVLKPRGRLALTVWDVPAKNPFFTAIAKPLEAYLPPTIPDPDAPGVFRLSPPGRLEQLLRDAGFDDVEVTSRSMTFEYASLEEYWQIQTDIAGPLKAAVASMAGLDVERLKAGIFSAITPYVHDGRVRMPAAPLCATGTNS